MSVVAFSEQHKHLCVCVCVCVYTRIPRKSRHPSPLLPPQIEHLLIMIQLSSWSLTTAQLPPPSPPPPPPPSPPPPPPPLRLHHLRTSRLRRCLRCRLRRCPRTSFRLRTNFHRCYCCYCRWRCYCCPLVLQWCYIRLDSRCKWPSHPRRISPSQ